MLGTAGYVVGMGPIGLALGMILRSTAGAVSALLAGVLVLPTLAGALLPEAWDGLPEYVPSYAASAFTSTVPTDSLLGTGVGAVVFALWICRGSRLRRHRPGASRRLTGPRSVSPVGPGRHRPVADGPGQGGRMDPVP